MRSWKRPRAAQVAEHGPGLDTDEKGLTTEGGFGTGQGMASQSKRTAKCPEPIKNPGEEENRFSRTAQVNRLTGSPICGI